MVKIKATIYIKSKKEGGTERDWFSGIQPSINIDGDLIASKIIKGPLNSTIQSGQEHNVKIEIPYGEMYIEKIKIKYKFELNIASKVIGSGMVEDIME